MGTKFGGNYPALAKGSQREHLMFVAAAGFAFSALIILLVVFNYKTVDAKQKPEGGQISDIPTTVVGTVTLFAADKYIRAGNQLSDYTFKDVFWPRNSVPDNVVRDLSELNGMYARVDIPQGVPIQRDHLTAEKRTVTLPITPGMRAVTIEVDAEAGIEGWALPGTRVDVALTHMVESNLTSKVIVQNARVLSYGGSAAAANERLSMKNLSKQARVGSTITLEASPGDALKIQTSRQLGSLSLLMRAPEDSDPTAVMEMDATAIKGGKAAVKKKPTNNGIMRIDGKEYLIDDDGSITQVVDPDEP